MTLTGNSKAYKILAEQNRIDEMAADCLNGTPTQELTAYNARYDAMSTLPDNDGLKRLGLRCIFARSMKMIIELCNLSSERNINTMIQNITNI